jgi:hypothetical protein
MTPNPATNPNQMISSVTTCTHSPLLEPRIFDHHHDRSFRSSVLSFGPIIYPVMRTWWPLFICPIKVDHDFKFWCASMLLIWFYTWTNSVTLEMMLVFMRWITCSQLPLSFFIDMPDGAQLVPLWFVCFSHNTHERWHRILVFYRMLLLIHILFYFHESFASGPFCLVWWSCA